jgi:hypothetical protein
MKQVTVEILQLLLSGIEREVAQAAGRTEFKSIVKMRDALDGAVGVEQPDLDRRAVAFDDPIIRSGATPQRVMERGFAFCPIDLPHRTRMAWLADYYERNRQPAPGVLCGKGGAL